MRTFQGTKFNYATHSDLSGTLDVWSKDGKLETSLIEIPWEDILPIVADRMRDEKISKIEQTEDEDILGIKIWKEPK